MHNWKEACDLIPGGNGLLSKRPQRYVAASMIDQWPAYYDKARGTTLTCDNDKYIDMAQMGIGSAILGYSNMNVDVAVIECIKSGVNTTLNSRLEPQLAEALINLDYRLNRVKFARTGGEAAAIAIRIARAASGRTKIAFSGYHGWHDWYIAANVSNAPDALNDHLLPGLKSAGVPNELANTSFPFIWNDSQSLINLLNEHNDIGVIVLEAARYEMPSDEFLNTVQFEASKRNIVIVLDEITSGFRVCCGGSYLKRTFKPDIVLYGKALGNGYAISAVVGTSSVMDYANKTFISSTFWTEAVGFAAGLATLNELRNAKFDMLWNFGDSVGNIWEEAAIATGLKLHVTEFKPLITFKCDHGRINEALYAMFSRLMLDKGYIASNSIYVSFAHVTAGITLLNRYVDAVTDTFSAMAESIPLLESSNDEQLALMSRSDGFKRLT